MSSEAVQKILEPYLLAIAACVAILLVTAVLLWRDGRARHEAEAEGEAPPRDPTGFS